MIKRLLHPKDFSWATFALIVKGVWSLVYLRRHLYFIVCSSRYVIGLSNVNCTLVISSLLPENLKLRRKMEAYSTLWCLAHPEMLLDEGHGHGFDFVTGKELVNIPIHRYSADDIDVIVDGWDTDD